MLAKEPEMLQQSDAFCKHAMQQNATATLGELTALLQIL